MIREHSKEALLVDEFNVQVFAGGRVHWDRLGAFLRRNPSAMKQLHSHLERRGSRRGRRGAVPD